MKNKISISAALFLFFSLCGPLLIFGQNKVKREKETSIEATEAPAKASKYMNTFLLSNTPKWYQEESQDGITYEAKFKHKDHKWSIEFDHKGILIDAEVKIGMSQLSKDEQALINDHINAIYDKPHLEKIQIHWKKPDDLASLLESFPRDKVNDRKYEIVLYENSENGWQGYEILLDKKGNILDQLKLYRRPSENLQF